MLVELGASWVGRKDALLCCFLLGGPLRIHVSPPNHRFLWGFRCLVLDPIHHREGVRCWHSLAILPLLHPPLAGRHLQPLCLLPHLYHHQEVCYIIWVIVLCCGRVAKVSGDEATAELNKLIQRLKWYPLILVVTWSWGTINRIHNSINPEDEVFWLFCLQAIFRGIYGVLNAMGKMLHFVNLHFIQSIIQSFISSIYQSIQSIISSNQ